MKSTDREVIPVFICYRRDGGKEFANSLYRILNNSEIESHSNNKLVFDVFLDVEVGAVEDIWKTHSIYLQKAKAFILICTPGVIADDGKEDWVHRELDWWIANRKTNPILITPSDFSRSWIPQKVKDKWPNTQWINYDLEKLEVSDAEVQTIRRKISDAIIPSYASVYKQEHEKEIELKRHAEKAKLSEEKAKRKYRFAFSAAIVLFTLASVFGGTAIYQNTVVKDKNILLSNQFAIVEYQNIILENQNKLSHDSSILTNQFTRIARVAKTLREHCSALPVADSSFKHEGESLAHKIGRDSCGPLENIMWDAFTWSGDPLRAANAHIKFSHHDTRRFFLFLDTIESEFPNLIQRMRDKKVIYDLEVFSSFEIQRRLEQLLKLSEATKT